MHKKLLLGTKLLVALMALQTSICSAQGLPFANVLVRALQEGRASDPVPDLPKFRPVIAMMQRQTGDNGPIIVMAMRVSRFEQQTRCGRVAFGLAQPSAKKAWPEMGGQLNLCEDGQPPLRVCQDRPNVLVPHTATCKDHSAPQDTAEVAGAIKAAYASGELSPEQVRKGYLKQIEAARAAAALSATRAASGAATGARVGAGLGPGQGVKP